jgi:hypothetical protein
MIFKLGRSSGTRLTAHSASETAERFFDLNNSYCASAVRVVQRANAAASVRAVLAVHERDRASFAQATRAAGASNGDREILRAVP